MPMYNWWRKHPAVLKCLHAKPYLGLDYIVRHGEHDPALLTFFLVWFLERVAEWVRGRDAATSADIPELTRLARSWTELGTDIFNDINTRLGYDKVDENDDSEEPEEAEEAEELEEGDAHAKAAQLEYRQDTGLKPWRYAICIIGKPFLRLYDAVKAGKPTAAPLAALMAHIAELKKQDAAEAEAEQKKADAAEAVAKAAVAAVAAAAAAAPAVGGAGAGAHVEEDV